MVRNNIIFLIIFTGLCAGYWMMLRFEESNKDQKLQAKKVNMYLKRAY